MEPLKTPSNGAPASADPGNHPLWWLAFFALVAAQAWMTLGLFSREHTTDRLLDETPVISGRHPLHLYHGLLGARSWLNRGAPSCYDPTFQAGYPKTPVFDDGAGRPRCCSPSQADNIGQASTSWDWPACVCWRHAFSPGAARRGYKPVPRLSCLRLGDARLVGQALPRSDRSGGYGSSGGRVGRAGGDGPIAWLPSRTGPLSLLGVAFTAFLGWYCHPLLMAAAAPLVLIYFFTVGARHHLLWHTCLAVAIAAPVAANLFWLQDWIDYWWLRTPLTLEAPMLTSRTLPALWNATIWGEPARSQPCLLPRHRSLGRRGYAARRRPATGGADVRRRIARHAGAGVVGRRLGIVRTLWRRTALRSRFNVRRRSGRHGLTRVLGTARAWAVGAGLLVTGVAALAALTLAIPSHRDAWLNRWRDNEPLQIGLNAERLQRRRRPRGKDDK